MAQAQRSWLRRLGCCICCVPGEYDYAAGQPIWLATRRRMFRGQSQLPVVAICKGYPECCSRPCRCPVLTFGAVFPLLAAGYQGWEPRRLLVGQCGKRGSFPSGEHSSGLRLLIPWTWLPLLQLFLDRRQAARLSSARQVLATADGGFRRRKP